jgi:shikimate dehydrogenase
MRQFGLIGYPLGHSFSKSYFSKKFETEQLSDCHYELFPIQSVRLLQGILESYPNLCGLNVTIPHKERVLDFLDSVDEAAAAIGAVNVIKITNGRTVGYNSDVYGFEQSLFHFLPTTINPTMKALILGTGGASLAVQYVLRKLNIPFQIVTRKKEQNNRLTYGEITPLLLNEHPLIINTTPLGMYPNTTEAPTLPYEHLTQNHFLFDLVYNPEETLFMKLGKKQGAKVKNGLEMLHLQAEKAWEIWQG